MHGYEMIKEIEERSGGYWRPSAGSIYPTLQLLEEQGLIAGEEAEGKRLFSLTDEGRAAIEEREEKGETGALGAGSLRRPGGVRPARATRSSSWPPRHRQAFRAADEGQRGTDPRAARRDATRDLRDPRREGLIGAWRRGCKPPRRHASSPASRE